MHPSPWRIREEKIVRVSIQLFLCDFVIFAFATHKIKEKENMTFTSEIILLFFFKKYF